MCFDVHRHNYVRVKRRRMKINPEERFESFTNIGPKGFPIFLYTRDPALICSISQYYTLNLWATRRSSQNVILFESL